MKRIIIILLVIISSCGTKEPNAYDKMSTVFIGYPSPSEIKTLMDIVITKQELPNTDDQVLKIGNALYTMRKESKKGVTEMEVLKFISNSEMPKSDLGKLIGTAATILELK